MIQRVRGKQVTSLDEFFEYEAFDIKYSSESASIDVPAEVMQSLTIRQAKKYIDKKGIFVAETLTNGDCCAHRTDKELVDELGYRICRYCSLMRATCKYEVCGMALDAWQEDKADER